jgi:Tfp pilus assembly protein PilE
VLANASALSQLVVASCLLSVQFWEDSTNSDQQYTRNRLRLSVLPQLTSVNTRAVQHIAAASELLQAEDELLEAMALRELHAAARQYSLLPMPAVAQEQQQQQQRRRQRRRLATPRLTPFAVEAVTVAAVPTAATAACSSSSSSSSSSSVASWGVNGLCPAAADMPSHPSADIAGMFQPTVWFKGLQAVCHKSGTALSIPFLQDLPRALKARVVRAWLQQQLPTAPTYLAVQEVLGLLHLGQGSGQRTGSLWGSSCVMRHSQLLVLLDGGDAEGLHAGRLRLEQQQQQQLQYERQPPEHPDHAWSFPRHHHSSKCNSCDIQEEQQRQQ